MKATSPVQLYLESLLERFSAETGGTVADYIPELASADPETFGICLATTDGYVYETGETRERFTLQSMSKPFTYGLALAAHGVEAVSAKVGVEPSGDSFNSISLAPDTGRPLNPMINAGAITSTSLVPGGTPAERLELILDCYRRFAGRPLAVNEDVFASERDSGHRNRAIGHMLRNFGILTGDPEDALDLYFRQCSVELDCRDLSLMAATLANGGVNPVTGERALRRSFVDNVLSVMTTCGMYDSAGSWVVSVGLPAKSGVSGGILAVLPGQLGIGVYSPPLDPHGNSVRGIAVCEQISRDLELHFLNVARSSHSVISASFDLTTTRSRRRRSEAESAVLTSFGDRARVFSLQGDVMFAGAERVVRAIVDRCDELEVAIIDMDDVTQLSESAGRLLAGLVRTLAGRDCELAFARIDGQPELVTALAATGLPAVARFDRTDPAIEWAEHNLLAAHGPEALPPAAVALAEHPIAAGLTATELAVLEQAAERRLFSHGDVIFRAGDAAGELFILLSGEVNAVVERGDGSRRRISTLPPGMTFGESAMAGNRIRTATMFGDRVGELRVLSRDHFERLGPELRAKLLENMLASTYQVIAVLTDEYAQR